MSQQNLINPVPSSIGVFYTIHVLLASYDVALNWTFALWIMMSNLIWVKPLRVCFSDKLHKQRTMRKLGFWPHHSTDTSISNLTSAPTTFFAKCVIQALRRGGIWEANWHSGAQSRHWSKTKYTKCYSVLWLYLYWVTVLHVACFLLYKGTRKSWVMFLYDEERKGADKHLLCPLLHNIQ